MSVTPSFPKAAFDGTAHAELRAGLRFLTPAVGEGSNGDAPKDEGAVSVKLGLGINTGAGVKNNRCDPYAANALRSGGPCCCMGCAFGCCSTRPDLPRLLLLLHPARPASPASARSVSAADAASS